VLDDFPDLTLADIQSCFAFASDRDRRLATLPYEEAKLETILLEALETQESIEVTPQYWQNKRQNLQAHF
jgi:hypothetical protein